MWRLGVERVVVDMRAVRGCTVELGLGRMGEVGIQGMVGGERGEGGLSVLGRIRSYVVGIKSVFFVWGCVNCMIQFFEMFGF